jgi:glucokinase
MPVPVTNHPAMNRPILIADIGATTTRTAFIGGGRAMESLLSVSNREAGNLSEYLADTIARRGEPRPHGAVLAVAAPVDGDQIVLTNHPWSFARPRLIERLGLNDLIVVNDFAAAAMALGSFEAADLLPLGFGSAAPGGTQLICGAGTGFGVAAVRTIEGKRRVIASEAGHMRFGAADEEEARLLAGLRPELGSIAVEHVLSGEGIVRLHRALHGTRADAKSIIAAAVEHAEPAQQTVALFLKIFGRVAGDLALAFDARGGVFLAGGVVRSLATAFGASPFLHAFQDHPPYEQRLAAMPVSLVLHSMPGLLGAAAIAREELAA